MKILRPRQKCETCNGQRETDCFGIFPQTECFSCHGTGYTWKLPPLEYVHPDLAYAIQRPSETQRETSRVFTKVVREKQSTSSQAWQG